MKVRTGQVKAGLRKACERGEFFHLWLHPENLGNDPQLFGCLEEILQFTQELHERGLLESLTMHPSLTYFADVEQAVLSPHLE